MAATPLDALADVYNAVGAALVPPAPLPQLSVRELSVPANRPSPPYTLLLQRERQEIGTQAQATAGGTTGVMFETLWADFLFWDFDPAAADANARRLLAALTPKCLTVTSATTLTEAVLSAAREDRHREARERQSPNPLGSVKYTGRLYRAAVSVKVRADYV